MMEIRNPTFTADGRIDCEVDHPRFGWIPFTASEDDPSLMGRAIFAFAMETGVAEYVPPPEPEPVPASAAVTGLRRLFRWPGRTRT